LRRAVVCGRSSILRVGNDAGRLPVTSIPPSLQSRVSLHQEEITRWTLLPSLGWRPNRKETVRQEFVAAHMRTKKRALPKKKRFPPHDTHSETEPRVMERAGERADVAMEKSAMSVRGDGILQSGDFTPQKGNKARRAEPFAGRQCDRVPLSPHHAENPRNRGPDSPLTRSTLPDKCR
jgi:hypothetical protein